MPYPCSNPWTTAFIWGNGDVTHCCYTNIGALGNINEKPLSDIWAGKKAAFVRKQMLKGDFVKAGCEQFCRVYRWNQFYGGQENPPDIPEGLGRIPHFSVKTAPPSPVILGMAMDWTCNLTCTHCQATRNNPGLTDHNLEALKPYAQNAKTLRFVDGEFTINRKTLERIRSVEAMDPQPAVFLNTNGQTALSHVISYLEGLKTFRLKFSLEGLGADYERVRTGAKWTRFEQNLVAAKALFDSQNASGKDWRLYLNFCAMKSNFHKIPEVVDYAVRHGIRLVINPINGMRHIDENVAMYEHLRIPQEVIDGVLDSSKRVMTAAGYMFRDETLQHLDYVIRVFTARKLKISPALLRWLSRWAKGQVADRLFYALYKWQLDKRSFFYYLWRKMGKTLRGKYIHAFKLSHWRGRLHDHGRA